MKNDALSNPNPDEYLYGRSGYLYTLMFLRREIGSDIIDKQIVIDVNKFFFLKKRKPFIEIYRYSKQLLNPVRNMQGNPVQDLH